MNIKKKAFLKSYVANFGNITASCNVTKIDRGTYYNWIKDKEFKDAVDNCEPKEVYKDFIENKLQKLINEDNPSAIIFACKTICKDRGYIERQEIETKQVDEFAKKTDKELKDELSGIIKK